MPLWNPNRSAIGRVMDLFGSEIRSLLMADFVQPSAIFTDDSGAHLEVGSSYALYHFVDAAQETTSNAVIAIGAGPRPCFLQHIFCQANVTMELFNGGLVLDNLATVPAQFARGTPARVVTAGDALTTAIDALSPTVTIRPDSVVGAHPLPLDHGNGGIFIAASTECQIIAQSANTSIEWVIGVRELTDPFLS